VAKYSAGDLHDALHFTSHVRERLDIIHQKENVMTETRAIDPPMLGRQSKSDHVIVLHELRIMSLFPDWIDNYPNTYNVSWVKSVINNTRTLKDIERWEEREWGLWYSLMTKWRSFVRNKAGF
jgi:hypothetical protein